MADIYSKTDRVYYVLKMKLKCDTDESTNWIKNRSVKYTKDLLEEKTLSFEWFVLADGKEATLIESFTDSDGAKQRAENLLASPIAQEWGERFEPTNWIVGGSVKQDLIDLLAPMGAKFHKYMDGFNKLSWVSRIIILQSFRIIE